MTDPITPEEYEAFATNYDRIIERAGEWATWCKENYVDLGSGHVKEKFRVGDVIIFVGPGKVGDHPEDDSVSIRGEDFWNYGG